MLKLSKFSRKKLGNAVGKRIPVYLATIATWFLTGLWHGAGWNFIVWGLLNCAVILVSQELDPLYTKFRTRLPRLTSSAPYRGFCMVRTFLLMGVIRSLDCYRDVGLTFRMWGSMFTSAGWSSVFGKGVLELGLGLSDIIVVLSAVAVVCAVNAITLKVDLREKLYERPALSALLGVALFALIILFGAYGIDYDATQFIYNQF